MMNQIIINESRISKSILFLWLLFVFVCSRSHLGTLRATLILGATAISPCRRSSLSLSSTTLSATHRHLSLSTLSSHPTSSFSHRLTLHSCLVSDDRGRSMSACALFASTSHRRSICPMAWVGVRTCAQFHVMSLIAVWHRPPSVLTSSLSSILCR